MNNGRSVGSARPNIRPVAPEVIHYPYQEARPSVGGSNHLHWTIQAFSRLQDDGGMSDVCTVNVEAGSEAEAVARAQDILQRAYYRVAAVNEICSKDSALRGE